MIILENREQTEITYLRREDILSLIEEELDDDVDVSITFRESASQNSMCIEDTRASEVRSALDGGSTSIMIKDWYWE